MRILTKAAVLVLLILACVPAGASMDDMWVTPEADLSFFGKIGAVALGVLAAAVSFPYSLMILGVLSLIALSRFGRERWRVWISIGILYVIPSIFFYGGDGLDSRLRESLLPDAETYEMVGYITTALVGIIAAGILYAKLIRPKIMS